MTTRSIAPTGSWVASAEVGPKELNIQNVGTTLVMYFIGSALPAAGYVGMLLYPGSIHPVSLGVGDTIYSISPEIPVSAVRVSDAV
jgi:hypothetical protein